MPAMWPVAESILNQWFEGFGEGGDQQSFGADTASLNIINGELPILKSKIIMPRTIEVRNN